MISPIGPINTQQPSGIIANQHPTLTPGQDPGRSSGGIWSPDSSVSTAGSLASSSPSSTTSLQSMQAEMGQLMENAFSGLQNDDMLRLIMGLFILMALLQSQTGGQTSQGNSQQPLDNIMQHLGNTQPTASLSYTSLRIEQSSSIVIATTNLEPFTGGSAGQQQPGISFDAWA